MPGPEVQKISKTSSAFDIASARYKNLYIEMMNLSCSFRG